MDMDGIIGNRLPGCEDHVDNVLISLPLDIDLWGILFPFLSEEVGRDH